jgi:hypothetical protein
LLSGFGASCRGKRGLLDVLIHGQIGGTRRLSEIACLVEIQDNTELQLRVLRGRSVGGGM